MTQQTTQTYKEAVAVLAEVKAKLQNPETLDIDQLEADVRRAHAAYRTIAARVQAVRAALAQEQVVA